MPSHPHCHWRDAQEWKSLGLEMSTPSDEACKMYDACLTQVVNHFDDPTTGGIEKCMEKMLQADPNFVVGNALALYSSGKKVGTDPEFAQKIYKLVELSEQPGVKPWERSHAQAVKYFAEGYTTKASAVWEDILVENPYDMMALYALHDVYILNGLSYGLRDSCGRAVQHWKPSTPLYGNLLGMYAFGLEETNTYDVAEKTAKKALEINRYDSWASHCMAHINEMTGRFEEGLKFMEASENTWNDSTLQCHHYWHWALFHYESMNQDAALGILDQYILPYLKKNKTFFALTDAATLLFRLESMGIDMGSRWKDCSPTASASVGLQVFPYLDLSVMLSFMGAEEPDAKENFIRTVRDHSRNGQDDIHTVYDEVALPILEAMQCYDVKNYSRAVELMMPQKYQAFRTGGSHAQRDLITMFTINAGMRSEDAHHQKYASHLLNERKMLKGETPLIESLLQKINSNQ